MRAFIAGIGSMGSAAAYFLSIQGIDVIGVDPYNVPHSLGSHSGHTRFIRKSYFEHPDYVPLLDRAYQLWYQIEKKSGFQFFQQTGLHYFGAPDCNQNQGVKLSSELHKIPIEVYSKKIYNQRFSKINMADDWEAIVEPEAGYIHVEKTLNYFIQEATKSGAIFLTDEKLMRWESFGKKIKVFTNKQEYLVDKLILTGGSGMPEILKSSLNLKLEVTRQILSWFMPEDPSGFMLKDFPCFTIQDPDFAGIFYGFPITDLSQGMKFAHHAPAYDGTQQLVENQMKTENKKLIEVLNKYFPFTKWKQLSSISCFYTYSKDEDFIIDFYPQSKNIIIAGGFSGHGFKFVPLVGEIITDLCMQGFTKHPIKRFAVGR